MTLDPRTLRSSASFPPQVIAEIQRAADQGLYEIRGFGTKRALPTFDDLVFLGASTSRYPLEGYREACGTGLVLGSRFAKTPIELKIPITTMMAMIPPDSCKYGQLMPRKITAIMISKNKRGIVSIKSVKRIKTLSNLPP